MFKLRGIKRKTLMMILEASKSTHPYEFCALLRYDKKRELIKEIMPLPGTLSGSSSSTLQLHMLPIDFNVIGTVHSHPSPSCKPSPHDIFFFEKFGYIHIIVCYPYDETSWCAYDFHGNEFELKVID